MFRIILAACAVMFIAAPALAGNQQKSETYPIFCARSPHACNAGNKVRDGVEIARTPIGQAPVPAPEGYTAFCEKHNAVCQPKGEVDPRVFQNLYKDSAPLHATAADVPAAIAPTKPVLMHTDDERQYVDRCAIQRRRVLEQVGIPAEFLQLALVYDVDENYHWVVVVNIAPTRWPRDPDLTDWVVDCTHNNVVRYDDFILEGNSFIIIQWPEDHWTDDRWRMKIIHYRVDD